MRPRRSPCEQPAPVATLEVSNPSEFARPDTLVSLTLNELGVSAGPLQVWEGDTALPTQLVDDDGDDRPDRLVFLTRLDAAATHNYVIDRNVAELDVTPRTHAEVSIKEGGEWQDQVYVGGTFKNVEHVTTPPAVHRSQRVHPLRRPGYRKRQGRLPDLPRLA